MQKITHILSTECHILVLLIFADSSFDN